MTIDFETSSSTFAETVRTMHFMLRAEITPCEASELLGVPEDRLAVYLRFVQTHIRTILEKNFSWVRAVLPSDRWSALVDGFFAAHPPSEREMNANAAPFPAYLAELANRADGITGAHAELAELEWKEFEGFASPIELPAPGELTTPALNPTLILLEFDYPVVSYASQLGNSAADSVPILPTKKSREIGLLFRHPQTHFVRRYLATDSMLFALKMFHENLNRDKAAELAGVSLAQVDTVVAEAIQMGLVLSR